MLKEDFQEGADRLAYDALMATRTQEACTSDLYDRFYTAMENATAAATTLADNIPDELMGTTGVISAALLAACRSDTHTDPESLNPITEFANQEWFMAMTSGHTGANGGLGAATALALTSAPSWFHASMMFSGPAEQGWLDFYTENVENKWKNPATGSAFSSAEEAWRELN